DQNRLRVVIDEAAKHNSCSSLLGSAGSKQARRPVKKNKDEDQKGEKIPFGCADIGSRKNFDRAEHESSDHRAWHVAKPPEQHNDQAFHRGAEAHEWGYAAVFQAV